MSAQRGTRFHRAMKDPVHTKLSCMFNVGICFHFKKYELHVPTCYQHRRTGPTSLGGGGGGGALAHLFFPCSKKIRISRLYSCNTRSKRLERKKEGKKKSHPKMKQLARISSGFYILLFFARIWLLELSQGGCSPPPPTHLVRIWLSVSLIRCKP